MIATRLLAVAILLGAAFPVLAHVMSMSNGELRLEGLEAHLKLDIPDYEVEQQQDPQAAVLGAFKLSVAGRPLERTSGSCQDHPERGSYLCEATYELPSETEQVEVECDLPDVTVPNHVHVLRAIGEGVADQKVFDYSFRKHEIRFRPPSLFERIASQAGAGALRVLFGPVQLLFLLALSIAARSRKELLSIAAAFVVAEAVAAVLVADQGWTPPARFIEAAGALTIAYVGVEILALPEAGGRWFVAACMGLFHGLYFGVFLQQARMSPAWVLSGVGLTEIGLLALLGLVIWRLSRDFGDRILRNGVAGMLLAVGLVWFGVRLFT